MSKIGLAIFLAAATAGAETLTFGRTGASALFRPMGAPTSAAIFLSGGDGWNPGDADAARTLAAQGALVVGVDTRAFLKRLDAARDACAYPAADLEALSQFTQKRLALPRYIVPVLVGEGDGATLAYAALAQAPPGTFRGGLGLGFRSELPGTKPYCRLRREGNKFLPAPVEVPWIPLADGEPQRLEAFNRLAATEPAPAADQSLADLPLVEVHPSAPRGEAFALILSGDGGWAGIDKSLGKALAARGVPVVGFNSLQYFWKKRTPEGTTADVRRILVHYAAAWKKPRVILIGYSFGAEVLPFVVNRLPAGLPAVAKVALLSPGPTTRFEFHVGDWLGGGAHGKDLPVAPEIDRIPGNEVLCFHGEEERDSSCRDLPASAGTSIPLPGGHHYDGNYGRIVEAILSGP